MKATRSWFLLCTLCAVLFSLGVSLAQSIEFEWARTYRLDPAKINQGLKVVKVIDGIVVGGTSASSTANSDYVVIKYKANGNEAWVRRYSRDVASEDVLRDMIVDSNGSVIVTGTSDTVKYDADGTARWTNRVAGRAVIANSDYVYITGGSDTNFYTVQLTNNASDGHQLWARMYNGAANDIDFSSTLAFSSGGVIVAGVETVYRFPRQGCLWNRFDGGQIQYQRNRIMAQ
jgi:outer membrane protein assembly factor BamB